MPRSFGGIQASTLTVGENAVQSVSIRQAKSSFFRLVDAIESGREQEIIITRDGRPVARLMPIDTPAVDQRIGVAKGLFEVPESIDVHNAGATRMFLGEV